MKNGRQLATFGVRLGAALLYATTASIVAAAEPQPMQASTQANVMVELAFTSGAEHADPFNTITLDAVVTDPSGNERRVPAFWAGGNGWKLRYSSSVVGAHTFRTECSDASDAGLHNIDGQIEVTPYTGANPVYAHGPLQVAPDKRHLQYADGVPFFWLGDTWWMGLSKRLHWPDDVKTLAQDRKAKGFNVIQIVMGPPPDSHPFDPRSVNEAGFPWAEDYAAIRPEYYDETDKRIMYLVDEGFTPCMVGMWGYHLKFIGVERAKQHWRYLIARYGALPVVWCAAGEANLCWYLAPGFPYDDREQVTAWTDVMRTIRATDPFKRLLTVHPTGFGWSARYCTDDISLIDFDLLQTPHGQRDAVDLTVGKVQESYNATPTMPVINGEAAYEMLGDSLPTRWTRQMFWLCMLNGAAGHTYGANGIWQVNRPGDPHGPSPQHNGGVGYGKIPWNEAMNLPGSMQVALGKKFFEQFPWQQFKPLPGVATYAAADGSKPPEHGRWIWFPEGDPTVGAPVAKRYFRKTIELPEGQSPVRGQLWLTVDDRFIAYVNGQRVGERNDWSALTPIDVTAALRPGRNVIAVEAENAPAPVADNPAGLIATVRVQFGDGASLVATSDETWRCTNELQAESLDWNSLDFDDSGWVAAKNLGPYGTKPWGELSAPQGSYGPYAAGIPGKVIVVYLPQLQAVDVLKLQPSGKYKAQAFDPANGKTIDLGVFASDSKGAWHAEMPQGLAENDCVLVIEPMP